MPETVLVTICCGGSQGDFELPARIPLASWEKALLEAVQSRFGLWTGKGGKLQLTKDRVQIQPGWTLEQCGIYDGSILQLVIG